MGFGTLNAVTLAAAVGLAVGGVVGVAAPSFAPSFAEAGPAPHPHRVPTVVTDVDVLGTDHMSITVRFSNTGRALRHIDPAEISVSAGGVLLRPRTTAAVDVRPGASVTSTFAFDVPPVDAALTLNLSGEVFPL